MLATLIRLTGSFDLAEEGLQDAYVAAAKTWQATPPSHPRAWLIRTARNRIIDRLRRRTAFVAHQGALAALAEIEAAAQPPEDDDEAMFGDDLLRLIFTCCHPSLAREAQVALTLRTVCGLGTPAVAAAFLVKEEAMAQRLVRAKAKIRAARIPYRPPARELLDERIEGVLATIYLIFTEAYAGDPRRSLAGEAIGLARRLDALMPGRPAVQGLLALMLLQDSRRRARVGPDGAMVRLEDQDRALWDQGQIAEGLALVERALGSAAPPSSYAVQAAIAALHARAGAAAETDWAQIVELYGVLMAIHPSPVIELNQAAAVSLAQGPAEALAMVDAIAARGDLAVYHLLPAARGHMLRRLGRRDEALQAYRQAYGLARFAPDRRLIESEIAALSEA